MAAKERIDDDRDRAVAAAHLAASLQRVKTLPKLDTLIRRQRPPKVQSLAEQKLMLGMLAERYGIPLRQQRVHIEP